MGFNDISFSFSNIQMDRETRVQIQNIAEQIYMDSPSDSCLKLSFEKIQDLVKVQGRIASQVGLFISEASDSSPVLALKHIKVQLSEQINAWKANRFNETVQAS